MSLHVYDLSQGLAKQLSNTFLGKAIEGIWYISFLFPLFCITVSFMCEHTLINVTSNLSMITDSQTRHLDNLVHLCLKQMKLI